jgi:hypothetical protein
MSGLVHPDQNVRNATQNSLCRAVNRLPWTQPGENAADLRRIAGLLDRYSFRVRYSGDMFRTTLSDRRLLQALPNIDANLLNRIVPIAEPIPL